MRRFCLVAAMVLSGCGLKTSHSQLQINNGIDIDDGKYPAVVQLGGCTGTFVSDTTLIYAAHCRRTTEQINRPFRAQSIKTFSNPRYQNIGQHDVAVAIFPPGTARATIPLFKGARPAGTRLHMIGFGCDSQGVDYRKKEGYNTLDSAAGGVLRSTSNMVWNNKGEDVSVCPGDSGGPLLIDGKLAGVTSYHQNGRGSGHPDLQNGSNMDFLRSVVAQGANIPGLEGPEDREPMFFHLGTPEAAAADQFAMHVAAKDDVVKVAFCADWQSSALCGSSAAGFQEATDYQARAGRRIFQLPASVRMQADVTYAAFGLNSEGLVVGTGHFRAARN